MSEKNIIRKSLRQPPEGRTDWDRVDRLSEEDIARAVESDPDAAPLLDSAWFESAEVVLPPGKKLISIRVDKDVLDYFQSLGPRYQTRINAVLKAYVKARQSQR